MSLRKTYTLIAPLYDALVEKASAGARKTSLSGLPERPGEVLLPGIGTGLDIPFLPAIHRYTGIDLTWAMLNRSRPRSGGQPLLLVQGDVQRLPFADSAFDAAVLHLILAVVPDPVACLRETARVLKPGGRILVLDKFLRPGQRAPLRRWLNPLARRLVTRTDVVFEEVWQQAAPHLACAGDVPVLGNGWFRSIRMEKPVA